MTFKVTILGSGSALPMAGKHHSAHALNVHEQFYLVDCGEGTQTRMMRYGISPMKIRAVFISHIHGDHIYGLFPLLSTMGMMGRKTPLDVFAPAPFRQIYECNLEYIAGELPFEVRYRETDTRAHVMIYENRVMEVWTIPLRHRIPAAGFLFREKVPPLNVRKEAIEKYSLGTARIAAAKRGEDIVLDDGSILPNSEITYIPYAPRSYAYCSDTLYSGKVASLVEGTDLLYHEATFAAAEKALAKETGHSTSEQAARTALKAGAGRLIIGHFSGRYKDTSRHLEEARAVFQATDIAVEGETFEIRHKKSFY